MDYEPEMNHTVTIIALIASNFVLGFCVGYLLSGMKTQKEINNMFLEQLDNLYRRLDLRIKSIESSTRQDHKNEEQSKNSE